jgi:hypothetical protein
MNEQLFSQAVFCGVAAEAFTISSTNFLKSSKPVEGIMMVSRRPPTSSVMRRKRPRGFSLRAKKKILRSTWILSVLSVWSPGLGYWIDASVLMSVWNNELVENVAGYSWPSSVLNLNQLEPPDFNLKWSSLDAGFNSFTNVVATLLGLILAVFLILVFIFLLSGRCD